MNNIAFIKNNKFIIPLILVIILVFFALVPTFARPYTVILLTSVIMFIVMTVSWTIFSGSTGYISLATAAFFGVGIYMAAIFSKILPIPLVVLLGGVVSFLLAFLVGAITLRLRGVYFAIFTFGLVELIKHVTLWWEINIIGTRGHFIQRVDNISVFYIMLTILVLLLITTFFIRKSKYGLALTSIGSSEEAAAHIGINVIMVKIFTFATSAFFVGLTGAIIATRWGYIDPYIAYNPFYSFLPVLMAIFGGLGNLIGPILGAAVFAYLQEYLITRFPYHYMLIFGTIMVITILYLPSGLIGLFQKIPWRSIGGKKADASS
ncbi:MAG: branched-chain amino acid ABC transporter permease [Bacillota bacterium]|nr:branched-chain amino acid ABC transporter permease [Bacillota bacterium]